MNAAKRLLRRKFGAGGMGRNADPDEAFRGARNLRRRKQMRQL